MNGLTKIAPWVLLGIIGLVVFWWAFQQQESTPSANDSSGARSPAGQRGDLLPPHGESVFAPEEFFPEVRQWIVGLPVSSANEAPPDEIQTWLVRRADTMRQWVRENPEAALAAGITPFEYAKLPLSVRGYFERPVAGTGFYGVLAICQHGPEQDHSTSCEIQHHVFLDEREIPVVIYGSRKERLTEEEASLYGVEFDGVLALHEADAVVFPAERMTDDPARSGQFAVVHHGETSFFADQAAVNEFLKGIRQ